MALNLSALKTALTDKQQLQADLQTAQEKITSLESQLATAQAEATAEKERANALQLQIDEANATIEGLNGKVGTLEKEKKTVAQSTVEKLSELGVPAAELPEGGSLNAPDDADIYTTWKGMTGPEKIKYRQENAEALARYAASQK